MPLLEQCWPRGRQSLAESSNMGFRHVYFFGLSHACTTIIYDPIIRTHGFVGAVFYRNWISIPLLNQRLELSNVSLISWSGQRPLEILRAKTPPLVIWLKTIYFQAFSLPTLFFFALIIYKTSCLIKFWCVPLAHWLVNFSLWLPTLMPISWNRGSRTPTCTSFDYITFNQGRRTKYFIWIIVW